MHDLSTRPAAKPTMTISIRATVDALDRGPVCIAPGQHVSCRPSETGEIPVRFDVRPKASVRNDGFSLLELVLVCAIVAVFAALAVPRYGSASARHRVELTAGRVAADLRLAQSYARVASSSRTASFDVAADEYLLWNVPVADGASGDCRVALSAEPYRADLVAVDFNGAAQVVFNGWGLPDHGGTVTVSVGSQHKTVAVDGATGLVSIP
jgi:prepilin-type N-terminal cleavage/methylation domain-containing protein